MADFKLKHVYVRSVEQNSMWANWPKEPGRGAAQEPHGSSPRPMHAAPQTLLSGMVSSACWLHTVNEAERTGVLGHRL